MDVRGFVTGLIIEVIKEFNVFSLIEKVFLFLQTNSLITLIIFAIALFILYRIVTLAFRIFLVVIAGLAFPFVMNFFFGWNIPITVNTLLFYATSAVVLYLLAVFLKGVGKTLKFITAPLRKKSEIKKIKKEVEKDIKEKKS